MINFANFYAGIEDGVMQDLVDVTQEINEWIEGNGIEVVNIETVVVPNLYDNNGIDHCNNVVFNTQKTYLKTDQNKLVGEPVFQWGQFFRVWYRT